MKKKRKLFRAVQPFFSALAVIVTSIFLLVTIYFTEFNPEWITFLAGVLVAAALAEATRRSYAEWIVVRRTAQLSATRIKLERETHLRKTAEKAVADAKPRLHLIDEVLPTMVAFVDREGNCRYHNKAFMEWLHLRPDQIDGQPMRKVLGAKVYQEAATAIRQSLDGHEVRYTRTETMQDGALYKLAIHHLPQVGETGKVAGFYMLINDITEPSDVRTEEHAKPSEAQDMFIETLADQVAGEQDVALITKAIENGDFRLYCQLITPLPGEPGGTEHYEILIRLLEEEKGMLPPGMFFPLAEKHGLMTHLDRWVVQHVSKWLARQSSHAWKQGNSMLFINISEATIADAGFPEFLQHTLLEHGVLGTSLCFEIPDTELATRNAAVVQFAQQVRQQGCHIALSGFGRGKVAFDLIRGVDVEYLKIDGSNILDILHDPAMLSKVTAINEVARKVGVRTIAEMVEDEATIVKLRQIGIDYAQGFGISRPRPLAG